MDTSTPPGLSRPAGGEIEDRFSEELAAVIATARRRAGRCGDRDLDTAHLLHSLLESDPEVRASLGDGGPQTAKLLGYLAQRCIGYGLRWRDTVEESGVPRAGRQSPGVLPGWSPAAVTAMAVAMERAEARGAWRVGGADLLTGLAIDRTCRAAEVLSNTGVDAGELFTALDVRGHRGDTPVGG
ncbi:MAG TPA: peptidase [Streptomyces sp.]|nr:peptidase [Streptomyces sp.]